MDGARFDWMAMTLARTRTRRGALRLLAGALAGAAGAGHFARGAEAEDDADFVREWCREGKGIPVEGLDGSFRCVYGNGLEIHCDPSGRCESHCWQLYGCSCGGVDHCHPGPRLVAPDGGAAADPGQPLAPPADGGAGGCGDTERDPRNCGRCGRRCRRGRACRRGRCVRTSG